MSDAGALSRATRAVATAAAAARRLGRRQWAALAAPAGDADPLAAFAASAEETRFYWERPADGLAIAGLGAAWSCETRGTARFSDAARAARDLFAELHLADGSCAPLLVGGFAFARGGGGSRDWKDFPPGLLTLPRHLLVRRGGSTTCVAALGVEPGADVAAVARDLCLEVERARRESAAAPPDEADGGAHYTAAADREPSDYRRRVARALQAIGRGDLEKVVVARAVRISAPGGFDPQRLLSALRSAHPSCASYAVARGGAVFLGATPERLARLVGDRIETAAVAGSAPRGRNPEEDERLGRELRESKKEQAEHAVVVRALREALADACDDLELDEAPRLLRLEGIQHLETPIRGRLHGDRSLVELLGSLHPSPAVGGAPRAAALRWLERHEALDRGWYGGPIGFVDASGDGEFSVSLRCALLRGDRARLFAGAGIVDGSRPEAELAETRLKLRALLHPLLEL
jgi:isochorismate synthase